MTKAKKRRKVLRQDVAGAQAVIMESFETHQGDAVETDDGNPLWHAEANIGYAKVLLVLANVQKELCRLDYKQNYIPKKFIKP